MINTSGVRRGYRPPPPQKKNPAHATENMLSLSVGRRPIIPDTTILCAKVPIWVGFKIKLKRENQQRCGSVSAHIKIGNRLVSILSEQNIGILCTVPVVTVIYGTARRQLVVYRYIVSYMVHIPVPIPTTFSLAVGSKWI